MNESTSIASIAIVRRSQRAISRDFQLTELAKYPPRDAFQEAAQHVVEHYFPNSVARGNTENISDLVELYVHAFVLAPLQYRLPGVYRPDWGVGTTLSWFRRCIGRDTKQWYWCTPTVEIDRRPAEVYRSLTVEVKIQDTLFAQTAASMMSNLAHSGGRKAEAAKVFLDPFAAAAFDRTINEQFHVRASGPIRRKLRAQGRCVASYLRRGSAAILLADTATARATESPEYRWHDINERPIQWLDYRIEWMRREEHLRIRLDDAVTASALREIKESVRAAPNPHRKYAAAVRMASRFLEQHQYATGSLEALRAFDAEVERVVSRQVTATVPTLVYVRGRVRTYDKLVLPMTNPFLVTSPEVVSNNTWISVWSPYR